MYSIYIFSTVIIVSMRFKLFGSLLLLLSICDSAFANLDDSGSKGNARISGAIGNHSISDEENSLYTNVKDSTTDVVCDCGPGANCTFENGTKNCNCPKGYEFIKDNCTDIDECKNQTFYPCYAENHFLAICRNTEGSYRCDCKIGFEQYRYSEVEPEEEHCEIATFTPRTISIMVSATVGFLVVLALAVFSSQMFEKWKERKKKDSSIAYHMKLESEL